MSISTIRGIVLVTLAAMTLAGCATQQEEEAAPTPVEPTPTTPVPEPVAPEPVKPVTTVRDGKLIVPLGDMGTEELQGLFYFDFDQAIVKRAGHVELNKHAMEMAADRTLSIRVEGHADERGTREYNLALGERRANAVKAYLQAQGALASQMEVISYGEEKPAVDGHDEQAWSQNRRVEIVYK